MESNLALILPNEGNPISSPQQPIPDEKKRLLKKLAGLMLLKRKMNIFGALFIIIIFWEL